jgi:hypothetical protein
MDGRSIVGLVTDIDMPGSLDGCGLAWRVHELFPEVTTVVISGVATPRAGPKRLVR